MDDAVTVAQAARQLFLLQVHDAHEVGQAFFGGVFSRCLGAGIVKQAVLLGYAHFGEQNPAHAVELGQGDGAFAKAVREHGPQARLKGLGLHVLKHFVLADDQALGNGAAQFCGLKLGAGDAGEDHAIAPGEDELALVGPLGLLQLRVALQGVDDLDGTVARLYQRVADGFGLAAAGVQDFERVAAGVADGADVPVFGFQDQRTPVRVQHHKIGVGLLGANRHVVPKQVVVFEFLLQPLGQALFAGRHAVQARAACGNLRCHVSE